MKKRTSPNGTPERLRQKRNDVLSILNSDKHYNDTVTTYYGDGDPFDVKIVKCDSCYTQAQTKKVGVNRFFTFCPKCLKSNDQDYKQEWASNLQWAQINLGSWRYWDLPFFGLSNLNHIQAKERMISIKHDLTLRRKEMNLNKQIKRRYTEETTKETLELSAYILWADLAIRLIREKRRKVSQFYEKKKRLGGKKLKEQGFFVWGLYDHPKDYPDYYIARKYQEGKPTDEIILNTNLEVLRCDLASKGLVCLHRNQEDPRYLIETWI